MTARATLRGETVFDLEAGPRGSVRQPVGDEGRLHVDRSLFFLVLSRSDEPTSLARHVAVHSPAYLIWQPEDDLAAASALRAITDSMLARFDRILLISLYDQPPTKPRKEDDPHLPPFAAWIGTSGDDEAGVRASRMLGEAMHEIEVDLRRCEIEPRSRPYFEPGVEQLVDSRPQISHLSLGLPRVHFAPSGVVYPQLFRDLSVDTGDSILRAACAFAETSRQGAPAHYRSLGRSAFLAAALAADKKIDAIARSFDFLLSVSPINTDEAAAEFLASDGSKPPRFRYRPLEVDPDLAKRRLYDIDLAQLEDPLLERLFAEKRREIEHQLTMIATRNTPAFRAASMLQYGAVGPDLLREAHSILDRSWPEGPKSRMIGASEVAKAARRLAADYRQKDDGFTPAIELREDLAAGLMVSGETLMISTHTRMAEHRLDALLAHEVSVHLVTCFNGGAQGLKIFRDGLAQYEGVQEGLGVFAEWAVGGLTPARYRLLAGRVVAVDAMLRGADFIECFRLLEDHGFRQRTAFSISARVYRSGGFAKDAIYLRGFKTVCDMVATGLPLDAFWLGKIAPDHIPAVEELLQRGLLRPARHTPEFLTRPDAGQRLANLANGSDAMILSTE